MNAWSLFSIVSSSTCQRAPGSSGLSETTMTSCVKRKSGARCHASRKSSITLSIRFGSLMVGRAKRCTENLVALYILKNIPVHRLIHSNVAVSFDCHEAIFVYHLYLSQKQIVFS